jgi:hypothetical protein
MNGGEKGCEFRLQIEDKARSHKDLRPSYAPLVHLLRERCALLNSIDFGFEHEAATSSGALGGGKAFDG